MPTVGDIYDYIDTFAPFSSAMSFDNVGLLVGERSKQVAACVLALDITNEVIDYAVSKNAELIITHHPIIFDPIKSIDGNSLLARLIRNNLNVISAHTNWDIAADGVNAHLARLFELSKVAPVAGTDGVVLAGLLKKPLSAEEFAKLAKLKLQARGVTYCCKEKQIFKVAILGGDGGDYVGAVIASGVDAFLTGEMSHDEWLELARAGICAVLAGHHYTEAPSMHHLNKLVFGHFSEICSYVLDTVDIHEV